MSFSGFQRALATQVNDISGSQKSLGLGGIIPLTATVTYTLIGSNLSQDQTVTVSGASINDLVIVGPPNLAAGLNVFGFVSAANTVTLRMDNSTAGGITPGALTFNILVLKP
jgi:hypothetical protein